MPDREERHLLSKDLGSGEPVSRASAQKNRQFVGDHVLGKMVSPKGVFDSLNFAIWAWFWVYIIQNVMGSDQVKIVYS